MILRRFICREGLWAQKLISEFTGGLDYTYGQRSSFKRVGTGAPGLWVEIDDASMAMVEGSLASKQGSPHEYRNPVFGSW